MLTTQTIKYRGCHIWLDQLGTFSWQHPNRVDHDPEIGPIWSGWARTVQECIAQIDEWHDRAKS